MTTPDAADAPGTAESGGLEATTHPARRRVGRVPLVLTIVLGGLIAALAATRPWVQGTVVDPVLGSKAVAVPGSVAAPALIGLALAGSAAGLAVAVAGRVARVAAALAAAGLGLGIVAVAIRALTDPSGVVASGASGAVGRGGHVPVSGATSTLWPYVAAAAGLAVVAAAIGVLAFRRAFTGLSGRYDTPATPADAHQAGGGRGGTARPAAQHVSDWDQLSRGDDPTAYDPDDSHRTER